MEEAEARGVAKTATNANLYDTLDEYQLMEDEKERGVAKTATIANLCICKYT